MTRVVVIATLVGIFAFTASAAEVIPPKPEGYFNDYAGVVSKATALQLSEKLAQFERDTSNQVLVAVFEKMETDSDVADYTRRIAQTWKVGQADRRNGAVLFVFIENRKMFIQVGYGLEGTLPDATAFDITERNIKPEFRAGRYEAGLVKGVDLMLAAIRGEYRGSGKTAAESGSNGKVPGFLFLLFLIAVIFIIAKSTPRRRKGYGYSSGGGPFVGGWGGGGSSSGSSGGGFSGFSGGGGSFGGGGAGSSW